VLGASGRGKGQLPNRPTLAGCGCYWQGGQFCTMPSSRKHHCLAVVAKLVAYCCSAVVATVVLAPRGVCHAVACARAALLTRRIPRYLSSSGRAPGGGVGGASAGREEEVRGCGSCQPGRGSACGAAGYNRWVGAGWGQRGAPRRALLMLTRTACACRCAPGCVYYMLTNTPCTRVQAAVECCSLYASPPAACVPQSQCSLSVARGVSP
jgi:hypothetical protein